MEKTERGEETRGGAKEKRKIEGLAFPILKCPWARHRILIVSNEDGQLLQVCRHPLVYECGSERGNNDGRKVFWATRKVLESSVHLPSKKAVSSGAQTQWLRLWL